MANYWFIFDDTDSSDIGLRVEGIPDLGTAQRDGEYKPTPGKSRDDYIDYGRYKNVEFSLNVALVQKGSKTVREMIDDVVNAYAYLQGYQYFEDSEHFNLATFAGLTNFGDFRREMRRVGKAVMKFTRDPFWYDVSGLQWQDVPKVDGAYTKAFTNPHKLISKPLIELKKSSNYSFVLIYEIQSAGGETVRYNVAFEQEFETLLIDCEKETAIVNGNTLIDVLIPKGFESGVSTFSIISGNVSLSSVKIMPRWRCL